METMEFSEVIKEEVDGKDFSEDSNGDASPVTLVDADADAEAVNNEPWYQRYGLGVYSVYMNSYAIDATAGPKKHLLYDAIYEYCYENACGDDFRMDASFKPLFYESMELLQKELVPHNLDNCLLTLETPLSVVAPIFNVQGKLSSENGWPLRLKEGTLDNGKKVVSNVTNTRRMSLQIAFIIMLIFEVYRRNDDKNEIKDLELYDNLDAFKDMTDFKYLKDDGTVSSLSPSEISTKRKKSKKTLVKVDYPKETNTLMCFGNVLKFILFKKLSKRSYRDFLIDMVTRLCEGNRSYVIRYWLGTGQTEFSSRREHVYRHACNKEKISKIKPEKFSCGADKPNTSFLSLDDTVLYDNVLRLAPQTAQIPDFVVPNVNVVTIENNKRKEELKRLIENAKKIIEHIESSKQSSMVCDDLSLDFLRSVNKKLRETRKRKASDMEGVNASAVNAPADTGAGDCYLQPAIICGGQFLDGFDIFEDNNVWFKRDFMFNI